MNRTVILLAAFAAAPASVAAETLDEIVVTSQRRPQASLEHIGNIEFVSRSLLDDVSHQHVHELLTRVAGVWLSRGSGQEHLTAIRSPVLTGAGSCGGFLFLEDGIPVRPAGFCNVNQLFEINTEQAAAIEVVRGPGNALYGSNALHGIVNVRQLPAADPGTLRAGFELGANQFVRAQLQQSNAEESAYAGVVFADDGGFRADSGYRQVKLNARYATGLGGGTLQAALALTDLDQETAGFIVGEDAYRDPAVNRSNPNPEAFRHAASQRLYAVWQRDTGTASLDVRPYVRHTDMRFLQHFLPGQPLEENGHVSAGVMGAATFSAQRYSLVAGLDIEWADVYLRETQFGPTEGSDFLRETRPEGKHYDYAVTSISAAPYVHAELQLSASVTLTAGLRAETIHYDYDNRMLDGNTRDDGTPCGFGGCLYTRPADRSDAFTNLAPKLGVSWALGEQAVVYVNAGRGFRAPQMTELYRLQSGQQVADLDSETLDSVEAGWRLRRPSLSLDVAVFAMQKRNSVLRDADGFNISDGRSRHVGIESGIRWQLHDDWLLRLDATWARHTYDFDRVAARGEEFVSGRDVDTAPRWLGSAELLFDPDTRFDASLQIVSQGKYFVDAENRFTYPGHEIANLRLRLRPSDEVALVLRINNISDRAIADRADFAFGNYRYFPGRGRETFVEIRYSASRNEAL
ncbi:MAG: TonB-dependent receptor [Woeseiaceae bacterium]|nr:TonB-dependent receptor [Woeseiaceae bacterium]